MIYVIIQARMGSTRLPNKVLMDLEGNSILFHVINRLKNSQYIDEIIVATSLNKENQPIIDLCENLNIKSFMGSEEDVLDRFYKTGLAYNLKDDDIIVRITADCPLIDVSVVDKVIELHMNEKNDYTTNTMPCTFPDGLDCEVLNFNVLKNMWKNACLSSEREHVTLYIRNHIHQFKVGNYENNIDLSHFRWTLDEKEDYEFIKNVYSHLYPINSLFSTEDVLNLLKNEPNLTKINNKFERNEGLKKSLKNDKIVGNLNDK